MKCDPIGIMVKIATNPKTPAKLRFLCAKELAQYLYPKRKAVEIREPTGPVELRVVYENPPAAHEAETHAASPNPASLAL